LKGGERHPTPRKALRRDITKNDKRKTVRAVTPLRFIGILVLRRFFNLVEMSLLCKKQIKAF